MAVPLAFDLVILLAYPGLVTAQGSVEFTLPVPLPSISQVHGQPRGSPPFFPIYPAPEMGQLTAPIILLMLGVQSYLTAGYLGALETARVGGSTRPFFRFANVYFSRVFAFNALIAVILLVLEPFITGFSYGLLVSIFTVSALILILYFLFLTPFSIVVDDYVLGEAFRRSVELSLQAWREILPYCLAYATVTILTSGALVFLVGFPIIGVPLAAALYGLVGTALVASTLHLYDGLQPEEVLPVAVPRPKPVEEAAPT